LMCQKLVIGMATWGLMAN